MCPHINVLSLYYKLLSKKKRTKYPPISMLLNSVLIYSIKLKVFISCIIHTHPDNLNYTHSTLVNVLWLYLSILFSYWKRVGIEEAKNSCIEFFSLLFMYYVAYNNSLACAFHNCLMFNTYSAYSLSRGTLGVIYWVKTIFHNRQLILIYCCCIACIMLIMSLNMRSYIVM